MDDKLADLNAALNQTYVAFGHNGASFQANQEAQDENAQMMSATAAASRAVTKASLLYNSADWDLVDAVREGQKLEELDEEELPEKMRSMDDDERSDYIKRQTEQRSDLQRRIAKLDKERRAYIDAKRKDTKTDSVKGLDQAIQEALRALAERKGFSFDES